MLVRRIVHTLCGVVLLGVLATSASGAMMDTRRTTHFTFSGTVQLPGVTLPAGTYTFEVANPDGGSDIVRVHEPRSEDGASPAVHAHHLSRHHGRPQGDRLPRRNSCRHPSTCESVVSAIRDARPRVHLLTITPLPPPCSTLMRPARRASLLLIVYRSPFTVYRLAVLPFAVYRSTRLFSRSIEATTAFIKPAITAFTSDMSFANFFRSDSVEQFQIAGKNDVILQLGRRTESNSERLRE